MDHISKHINSSKKNHSHDKMSKIVVNLGSKKFENNNNSTWQLNNIQNLLLMSIVDNPENYISNVDRKLDERKVRTSSIKSSSTLFSCSTREIYNIFHRGQNKRLVLKSYIPDINTSILRSKIMKIYFIKN